MSAEAKKSVGRTIVLMILGVAALYGGAKWAALLIPAAVLVWYGRSPRLRSGRN